ncbi:unnamed protein product [Sphagnum jensenii]|uniref:DUF4005 domain-containing protein n=1 Tax=Sphagnum jensenii TaxID=128206 RepID=A0ABP0X1K8_9BRYO
MGKANPGKWFKAVTKAFRSPSKEKAANTKAIRHANFDNLTTTKPVPLPLPTIENTGILNGEQERSKGVLDEELAGDQVNLIDGFQKDGISQSKGNIEVNGNDAVSREEWAAIKIQRAFRSHLVRWQCEYFALKGVIRLQALVRGHTVRRQAATTLRAMEALVRVQARVRARRVRMSEDGQAVQQQIRQRRQLVSRPIKAAYMSILLCVHGQLKRSTPQRNMLFIDTEPDQPHWGWSWMDRWMAARPWENRSLDQLKDGSQAIPSLKSLEARTKHVDKHVDPGDISLKVGGKSSTKKGEEKPVPVSRPVQNGKKTAIPLPLPSPPHIHDSMAADLPIQNTTPSGEVPSTEQALSTEVENAATQMSSLSTDVEDASFSSAAHEKTVILPPSPEHPFTVKVPSDLPSSFSQEPYELKEVTTNGVTSPLHSPGCNKKPLNDIANNTKEAEAGENDLPASFKPTTSRYMAATESAKAKFRLLGSPQNRTEGDESPRKHQKRLSLNGVAQISKPISPAPRAKSISQVRTSLPGGLFKEKSIDMTGIESPIRRKSLGGDQGKAAVKWR